MIWIPKSWYNHSKTKRNKTIGISQERFSMLKSPTKRIRPKPVYCQPSDHLMFDGPLIKFGVCTSVYPIEYVCLFYFVLVILHVADWCRLFTHVVLGSFIATGTIVWLPQYRSCDREGYGNIDHYPTTTSSAGRNEIAFPQGQWNNRFIFGYI